MFLVEKPNTLKMFFPNILNFYLFGFSQYFNLLISSPYSSPPAGGSRIILRIIFHHIKSNHVIED